MPELPEVETIRRFLVKDILGKKIKNVEIKVPKQFIGNKEKIIGQRIISIDRKGKILSLKLKNNLYINFHLKLTGQLLFAKKQNLIFKNKIPFNKTKTLPGNTTRIILSFTDNSFLYFNDLRKFGWLKITQKPEIPKGVDVVSKDFSVKYLTVITRLTQRPIKLLLMDQDKIAGIGNIYTNDALFLARIHPMRKSNSLTNDEIKNLYKNILYVIKEGLKYDGTSDEAYVLPDASLGKYQDHFRVYGREKLPCLRCKTLIKRVKHAGRSYFYCPNCQK